MTSEIKVDTISEQTSANGVTIDGLTIKDGNIIGDVALAGTTPTFTIGDGGAEDAALIFDGNAVDFVVGLDDSADEFRIGVGSGLGSDRVFEINSSGVSTFQKAVHFAGSTPTVTVGDGGAEDAKILFDGNAQNFHIGLDDSEDKLTIGLGNNLGTYPAITIDENTNVVIPDSSLTIAGTGNYDLLTLKSTDADANVGPVMNYYRNSSSPADNDYIGKTVYVGRNDNSQDVNYVAINVQANDVSDGSEDGSYVINTMRAGALDQTFSITPSEVIINDDSKDVDFRVESNSNTHALFVDGGNNVVLIGSSSFSDGSGDTVQILTAEGRIDIENNSTSLRSVMLFYNPNGAVGSIRTTGSATQFNTSSDYRLKENVSYDFDATTRLKQLKPARFNFIADADTTVDGFLAHEVSSVVPEAISGTKDAVDEDGKPEYQGIDQSKLVPLLVKTIQELEARITTLEG